MHKRWFVPSAVALSLTLFVGALAQGGHDDDERRLRARLSGFEETPAVSTVARGDFKGMISRDGSEITYRLSYTGLEAPVRFAHIHLGQKGVSGSVVAFLCGGGSKPACPQDGSVEGTIVAADVIGPSAQGIDPGELGEFLRAIRRGVTYANVHSDKFPGGEIRGQIKTNDD